MANSLPSFVALSPSPLRSVTINRRFSPCVVIPVYDHEQAIAVVVERVLAAVPHTVSAGWSRGLSAGAAFCILVDDGSHPACAKVLDQLVAATPDRLALVRLAVNGGKGAAVLAGMAYAARQGFTHVLQIDADGQHCAEDIPLFLRQAEEFPESLIVGYPLYDSTVPRVRLFGRYLTHIWVWIATLSLQIRDSMCGFRVYPLVPVIALAERVSIGRRMNFDTDILVRLVWDGLQVINLPTRVTYPQDGVSHFRVVLDNLLITRMHAKLFFGMLYRLPTLLGKKMVGRLSEKSRRKISVSSSGEGAQ